MHALLLLSSSAGNLHIYLACDNTCVVIVVVVIIVIINKSKNKK